MNTLTRSVASAMLLCSVAVGVSAQTAAPQPSTTIGVTPGAAAEATQKAAETGATGAVVRTGPTAGEKARELGNTAADKARDAGSAVRDTTRAAGNAVTGGTASDTTATGERAARADRN